MYIPIEARIDQLEARSQTMVGKFEAKQLESKQNLAFFAISMLGIGILVLSNRVDKLEEKTKTEAKDV